MARPRARPPHIESRRTTTRKTKPIVVAFRSMLFPRNVRAAIERTPTLPWRTAVEVCLMRVRASEIGVDRPGTAREYRYGGIASPTGREFRSQSASKARRKDETQ